MMIMLNEYINQKNSYCFNSVWKISAPLDLIWNELVNYRQWPVWCRALETIEPLYPFHCLQKGNSIRSTWKGDLPYRICFDAVVMDFAQYSFLSFHVTGDLCGQGVCHFFPGHGNTTVQFIWKVSPTKFWMRLSAPFARSVFMENHDRIMDRAVSGFTRMIEKKSAFYRCCSSGVAHRI